MGSVKILAKRSYYYYKLVNQFFTSGAAHRKNNRYCKLNNHLGKFISIINAKSM